MTVELQKEVGVDEVAGFCGGGQTNKQAGEFGEVVQEVPAAGAQGEPLGTDCALFHVVEDVEAEAQVSMQTITRLLPTLIEYLTHMPSIGQGPLPHKRIKLP